MRPTANQHTAEYTLADLRRVAACCIDEMRGFAEHFDGDELTAAEAALAASETLPAAQSARRMLSAVERIAESLEFAAESTDCPIDTVYAGLAGDACSEARASMRHGGW